MQEICKKIRSIPDLMVREDQPCWVERYMNHTSSLNVNNAKNNLTASIASFMTSKHQKTDEETGNEATSKKQYWDFKQDIVTEGKQYDGDVKMVQIRVKINVANTVTARELKINYTHWEKFIVNWNKAHSEESSKVMMVSLAFTKMDTELRIVRSTLDSWILSNVICLISVLLFTQNIVISMYTMLAIFLIVASLMGVIFGLAQYPFGAIEAVGITIFVGLSVDYCLHTAHGYHDARSQFSTRKQRVQDMLTKLGISIAGAAVTTAGSCIFLFFCRIFLFLQLGVMLFANCLIAVVFSLFFLSALLMTAGPMGQAGEILYTLQCGCCRNEKNNIAKTAVVPTIGTDFSSSTAEKRADDAWSGGENRKDEKLDSDKEQENWEI